MYIVYVIKHNLTHQIYIGITSNLNQRLKSHNSNANKATRKRNGVWVLVYGEIYHSKKDAVIRESRLKQHGSSKHELLKRISNSLLEAKSEAG